MEMYWIDVYKRQFMGWKKKQCVRERKKRLNYQFRDALNSMSVAVQAGYSVENAVSACTRDMERLYDPDSDICLLYTSRCV